MRALRGWRRNAQILSVASGERMCSNLQACSSISDSLSQRKAFGKKAFGEAMAADNISPAASARRELDDDLPSPVNMLWAGWHHDRDSRWFGDCGASRLRPGSRVGRAQSSSPPAMLTGRAHGLPAAHFGDSPMLFRAHISSSTSSNCSSSSMANDSWSAILPMVQLDSAVREAGHDGIVRHHHDGPPLDVQLAQKAQDDFFVLRIEIAGGFIGENDLRIVDQRAWRYTPVAAGRRK